LASIALENSGAQHHLVDHEAVLLDELLDLPVDLVLDLSAPRRIDVHHRVFRDHEADHRSHRGADDLVFVVGADLLVDRHESVGIHVMPDRQVDSDLQPLLRGGPQ